MHIELYFEDEKQNEGKRLNLRGVCGAKDITLELECGILGTQFIINRYELIKALEKFSQ